MSIAFPGMEAPVKSEDGVKRTFSINLGEDDFQEVEAEWLSFEPTGHVCFWMSAEPYSRLIFAATGIESIIEKERLES